MRILAFESSAKAASVALLEDKLLVAENYLNIGKTHSTTLMTMAEHILNDGDLSIADIDYIAVAKGPGSFTGVRIGVAAAKGLAWAAQKPCCGVSTLEAMAFQLKNVVGTICPVMDARREQVYTAVFASDGSSIQRIYDDKAISLDELEKILSNVQAPVYLVGDGSRLCYDRLHGSVQQLQYPPEHLEFQRASGVAMAAAAMVDRGEYGSSEDLVPNYLRLSQAERERLSKMNHSHEQLKGDV